MNPLFVRNVDKKEIPICNILGVNIAAINMEWLTTYICRNINEKDGNKLNGDYICVSNVHTTVMSYKDENYCTIQNSALMAIPDGGPLSHLGKIRGYKNMDRVTGPDFMSEVFKQSEKMGYKHYFFGSSENTLELMKEKIKINFPNLSIVGSYSPPFRKISDKENLEIIRMINMANADFVWVGLGAPKQENWMKEHQGQIKGLMVGVGAGFDYFAGNIKRAPRWMQKRNLEWLYRLIQDPKRLFKRYFVTNITFIFNAYLKGK